MLYYNDIIINAFMQCKENKILYILKMFDIVLDILCFNYVLQRSILLFNILRYREILLNNILKPLLIHKSEYIYASFGNVKILYRYLSLDFGYRFLKCEPITDNILFHLPLMWLPGKLCIKGDNELTVSIKYKSPYDKNRIREFKPKNIDTFERDKIGDNIGDCVICLENKIAEKEKDEATNKDKTREYDILFHFYYIDHGNNNNLIDNSNVMSIGEDDDEVFKGSGIYITANQQKNIENYCGNVEETCLVQFNICEKCIIDYYNVKHKEEQRKSNVLMQDPTSKLYYIYRTPYEYKYLNFFYISLLQQITFEMERYNTMYNVKHIMDYWRISFIAEPIFYITPFFCTFLNKAFDDLYDSAYQQLSNITDIDPLPLIQREIMIESYLLSPFFNDYDVEQLKLLYILKNLIKKPYILFTFNFACKIEYCFSYRNIYFFSIYIQPTIPLHSKKINDYLVTLFRGDEDGQMVTLKKQKWYIKIGIEFFVNKKII